MTSAANATSEVSVFSTPRSLVIAALGVMYGALAICVVLMPRFLFSTNMGGVSNYGVHLRTVVFYTLGTVAAAALLWRAARFAAGTRGGEVFARACRWVAVLHLVTLATTYPYKRSDAFGLLHSVADIALAVAFVVFAVLLARRLGDRRSRVLLALVLVGFALLFVTYIGLITVLFVAEVVTGLAFGALLVHAAAESP